MSEMKNGTRNPPMSSVSKTFKKRAVKANRKISRLGRATSKARIVPLPAATQTAGEQIEDYDRRLQKSSAPQYKKDRRKKMLRRDI